MTNDKIKDYVVGELVDIVSNENTSESGRIQALAYLVSLSGGGGCKKSCGEVNNRAWYQVGLQDLTVFFLRCTVALLPSVGLSFCLYVLFLLFNYAASMLLGGGML